MLLGLWTQAGPRNDVLDGVQIPPSEGTILRRAHYLHGKWLAERATETARTTILLQRNPSFGEMLDQVHFRCRKLCCLQCFDAVGWAAGKASGL